MQAMAFIQKLSSRIKFNDFTYSAFFGLLSSLFSLIQFKVPNYESAYSDLREIPLLISLLYIRNPFYILLLCILTPISYLGRDIYLPTVIMHLVPLIIFWFIYQQLKKRDLDNIALGTSWFVLNLVFYFVLIFPAFIITYQNFGLDKESFLTSYKYLAVSGVYEITATALVTTLYTVQFSIRENLESLVIDRTHELTKVNNELQTVNEELQSTNEEVKSLNENLEKIVIERTKKINRQLEQLSKYAHMNSHEVRAPLARMLGLMSLMKVEKNELEKEALLIKLISCSEELDGIIKRMNILLEEEVSSN